MYSVPSIARATIQTFTDETYVIQVPDYLQNYGWNGMAGQEFEDHAYKYLRREFKDSGWQIERHPFWWPYPSSKKRIPDFIITRVRGGKKEAVIAEAKYVQWLRARFLQVTINLTFSI